MKAGFNFYRKLKLEEFLMKHFVKKAMIMSLKYFANNAELRVW